MAKSFLHRSGIYCIRNLVSNRVYVGSGVSIQKRWVLHRSLLMRGRHHSPTLQRSWLKYGPEAFVFEILEFVEDLNDKLTEREQYWMDTFDSANPATGFNIAPKARSSKGRIHPPEIREKMSRAGKGKKKPPFTAAHKAAISAGRIGNQWGKGIPKTPEHRAKLSAAKKGKKNPAISESNRRRARIAILADQQALQSVT